MNQAYTQLCYGQFTINIPIPLDKEGGGLQKKKWPLGPQFGLIINKERGPRSPPLDPPLENTTGSFVQQGRDIFPSYMIK